MKYPDDFIDKVICGDCLKILPLIPDNSVDLILTDPPYNISRPTRISRKNMRLKTAKRNSDINFDFGDWDKFTPEGFDSFTEKYLKECYRVLRNGSAVIFTDRMYISNLWFIGEEIGFFSKQVIVWHKTNPVPQFRSKNFLSSTEFIIWLVKNNSNFTLNFGRQKEMHNFIEGSICMGDERTSHPTQKPEYLIERLVNLFSNRNDIVLDCFLGSGTTAVACKKLNRRFIGIEINPEYCKMAEERLSKIPNKLNNWWSK